MTLVYVLLALAGAGVTGLTMYFIGKGRRAPVVTRPTTSFSLADVVERVIESSGFGQLVLDLRKQTEGRDRIDRELYDRLNELEASAVMKQPAPWPPLPPPAPAREDLLVASIDRLHESFCASQIQNMRTFSAVKELAKPVDTPAAPVIDMKSLLQLVHEQQLSMIGMVAGVVKDISEHAAATVTAPLLAQMNRAAPPQSQMIAPVPWYGREDVAVTDGADPFDRFMGGGNPYYPNNTAAPTGGYVTPEDDEPFGIPGMKWPAMQEGMVKPGSSNG